MTTLDPATIEDAVDVEHVTDDQVATAEREATEAVALVGALEARVVNGDETVTHDEIEQARSLGRFARLRAQATARKAERARRAAWLRQCDELRAEIAGYAPGSGERFAEQLAGVESAVNDFIAAIVDRNRKIQDWRKRMQDLGGLNHAANPLVPPASQAHIGLSEAGAVIGGRVRMEPLDANALIVRMLARVRQPTPGGLRQLDLKMHPGTPEALYEGLAQVDAPAADPDPNLRFFRGPNGAVLALDRDLNEHEQRNGLKEISRKQAWGQ